MSNPYVIDARCHNAEPGTYGHECSKPATWIGTHTSGYESGYCDDCKAHGYEARGAVAWRRHVIAAKLARCEEIARVQREASWSVHSMFGWGGRLAEPDRTILAGRMRGSMPDCSAYERNLNA